MAETKQYLNRPSEKDGIMISEDVIATIVTYAVSEVEGVAGLTGATLKNRGKSIRISISQDDSLSIECNIIVYYGQSVFEAAKAVQAAIDNAVQAMTGVTAEAIHVNVTGIIRK